MLHRPGLTGDLAAAALHFLARLVGVIDRDRDVAVGVAELVFFHAPVAGELEHRRIRLLAVADEGEGEFTLRVVLAAQQPHAEHLGVETQRFFKISHPQHGVKHSHIETPIVRAASAPGRSARAARIGGADTARPRYPRSAANG